MQTALPRQASRIRHTFKQFYLDKKAESDTFKQLYLDKKAESNTHSNSSISTRKQNQTHIQTALSRQSSRIRHTFKQLYLDKQAEAHTFIRLVSPSDDYCRPTLHIQDVRTGSQPSFPRHFLTQRVIHPTLLSYTQPLSHCPRPPTYARRQPAHILQNIINTSLSQQNQLVTCRTFHCHSAQATGQNTAQRFPSTANNSVPRKPPLLLFSILFSLSFQLLLLYNSYLSPTVSGSTTTFAVFLFCTMTNKCTIISQSITQLHVSTLSCHPRGACNQYLGKLHKYFKCSCW